MQHLQEREQIPVGKEQEKAEEWWVGVGGVCVCAQGREGCHTGRLLVRKWVCAGLGVGRADFWEKGGIWL